MLEKRVKIQSVVENQLPDFLRTDSYKAGDFLKTYYKSTEFQGGPVDILENIDQYVKVGTYTSIIGVTSTTAAIDSVDSTISVEDTSGWPDSYGLLKINDEIISYTGKTGTTFTGCIRGFSGITNLETTLGVDDGDSDKLSIYDIEVKLKTARVRKLDVETAQLRGNLIPKELVSAVFGQLNAIDRSQFLTLADTASAEIAASMGIKNDKKVVKINKMILDKCYQTMKHKQKMIEKFLKEIVKDVK